jgi:hypothetical protein
VTPTSPHLDSAIFDRCCGCRKATHAKQIPCWVKVSIDVARSSVACSKHQKKLDRLLQTAALRERYGFEF